MDRRRERLRVRPFYELSDWNVETCPRLHEPIGEQLVEHLMKLDMPRAMLLGIVQVKPHGLPRDDLFKAFPVERGLEHVAAFAAK